MSTYISKKWFNYYSGERRRDLTFKFGKNKAKYPHDRSLSFEWSFHKDLNFSISFGRRENQAKLAIQFLFFSLFTTCSGLTNYITRSDQEWEYSVSFHHWVIWWNFGCSPHQWSTSDGWRNKSFDFLDFLLGRTKHANKNRAEHLKTLKLPEGDYAVQMVFEDCVRWRPRVPKFIWKGVVRRVGLEITPAIPYPGKNGPVGGYSKISFPAKSVEEVLDHIYKDIKKKRQGDIGYYANDYRKMVDDYTYTINGLPVNLGRVPVEWRNKEWHPIGCSSAKIADETFRKLWKKEEKLTPEELGFINKYMGNPNSIDFIKSTSQDHLQDEMKEYFKTRNMKIGCEEGSASYAVPSKAS